MSTLAKTVMKRLAKPSTPFRILLLLRKRNDILLGGSPNTGYVDSVKLSWIVHYKQQYPCEVEKIHFQRMRYICLTVVRNLDSCRLKGACHVLYVSATENDAATQLLILFDSWNSACMQSCLPVHAMLISCL